MSAPASRGGTRVWRNVALGVAVSAVFLYLAFRNVPLADLGAALQRLHPGWLAISVALSFVLMLVRAVRWQLELRPLERVPLGTLWVVTAVGYMAINVLPARLGEVVRPWLLSRRAPVSFSNVVGNLVVEKTMDSVVTLVYTIGGLLLVSTLPLWVRRGALVPAVVAAVLIALVVLVYARGEAFVDRYLSRVLPTRFRAGVQRAVSAIVAGMRILPNPGLLATVFVVSLGLWFLPILSSWVMIRAFDLPVPASAAIVVFIFIGFGTALPGAPGMIGIYQYACQQALALFGVHQADGLAYGLVLNAVQFATIVAQGLVALPFAGIRWADVRQAGRTDDAP